MVPNDNTTKQSRKAAARPAKRRTLLSVVVKVLIILSVLTLLYVAFSAYQAFTNQFDYLKQPESQLISG